MALPAERLRTAGAGALAGLLLVGGLAGCASPTEKYCSTLKDDKAELGRLASSSDKPQGQVLRDSLGVFEDLQDAAPQDIAADWDDFVFAWRSLVDALDEAGVDPGDFDPAHPPAGVSKAQVDQIEQAAEELRSDKVTAAATRIEDHAQSVCKVSLGGAGLGVAGGS